MWTAVLVLVLAYPNPQIFPGSLVSVHSSSVANVTIVDYAFRPASENVTTGTMVVWTYLTGGDIHTVTSVNETQAGSPVFASGPNPLHPGQSYNFTFYSPGKFAYYCAVHPSLMKGWVYVTGPPITPPLQPSSNNNSLLTITALTAGVLVLTIAGILIYRRRLRTKPIGSQTVIPLS